MIASDVAIRVRRTFGDEASVQITDDDILRWINDAQINIATSNEGLMETSSKASTVAGQREYASPPDLSVLRSLAYQGFKLKSMSFNEFNEYITGFNAPSSLNNYGTGVPTAFMVWQGVINLFPVPAESIVDALYIYYIRRPTDVTTTADELTIPREYHTAVVDYCLQQAYLLDEDTAKSQLQESRFDRRVTSLNDRNKWTAQEYYPGVTVNPEDSDLGFGSYGLGTW